MAPVSPELEVVDLTTGDMDISRPVVDATPRIDSANKAASAPQFSSVGEGKKKFKVSDKHPESDEVLLLELVCMEDEPYLSSHGDNLARWKNWRGVAWTRFKHAAPIFPTAEHIAWLDKASGVEDTQKADKEAAKVQADNLGKAIRDVAMCRLSEKQDDYLPSSPTPAKSESSASSTTSTPSVTSSAYLCRLELKHLRQIIDRRLHRV
ncbi:hypothetical protein V1509DRAFT_639599 [Lipomyces kononenkoae]